MVVRVFFSLISAVPFFQCAAGVVSARTYSLVDLGDLEGGNGLSVAFGINDRGEIVGYSDDPVSGFAHAFLWENGVMTNLGALPAHPVSSSLARDINENGQVVGYSGSHAFLWQDGTMFDLGDFVGGDDYSEAFDINNAGQIVGRGNAADIGLRAFLWDNGTMSPLPTIGPDPRSTAVAINDIGQIIGHSSVGATLWHAGNISALEDLDSATDINNHGQIAGLIGGNAVLWDDGKVVNLGRFVGPFDGRDWEPKAISDQTEVVGAIELNVGGIPFVLSESDGIHNLNCLVDESAAGWSLIDAQDINNSGWIVGVGFNPEGRQQGYLLVPNPTTLPGDTNADGTVDIDDLNSVRNNFGADVYIVGPVGGNANQDCQVDVDDLNLVRNHFGASAPATAAPEPGAGLLLFAGFFFVARGRRRRR